MKTGTVQKWTLAAVGCSASGSEALTINWCLSSESSWAASEGFTELETVYSDTVQILQKPVHTWWVKIQSGCFSGWRLLFSAGSDSNNSRTFMLNVNVVFLKITRNDPTCRITPEILIWFEKMFFYTFISWNLHRRCWAKSSITWWCVSTERGEEDWINIFGWTVPLRGGLFGPNSIWNMSFSGRQFCEAPSKERRVCCKEVSFDPALNR